MNIEKKIINESHQGKSLILEKSTSTSKKVFLESYGCQMNLSDSEIVLSILSNNGYNITQNLNDSDLILLNTCSIREKPEQTIYKRLSDFKSLKTKNPNLKIGVLGCMAERLKSKFLEEKLIDLIVGPDSYKDLPKLLKETENGSIAINVTLSKKETYEDIQQHLRLRGNGVTAFVTITRGCDNMCTFCIVPFTRGRERSRNPDSIIGECQDLVSKEYKEIILLGQNVDSYIWFGGGAKKDFEKATDIQKTTAIYFADLLIMIAKKFPQLRIRFSTSNPQDMSLDVLHAIEKYPNICKSIHLPVQSGSNSVLKKMNRQHTREEYLELIRKAKKIIPEITFSCDIIVGFCGETEEDHSETLSLIQEVEYDFGYMFSYSHRPGTFAYKKMRDDVSQEIKKRRLSEVIQLQNKISKKKMQNYIGKNFEVLIEENSKKSTDFWRGRISQNAVAVFPKTGKENKGDFVQLRIDNCTSATLLGKIID